jgi:hypothetical protein
LPRIVVGGGVVASKTLIYFAAATLPTPLQHSPLRQHNPFGQQDGYAAIVSCSCRHASFAAYLMRHTSSFSNKSCGFND